MAEKLSEIDFGTVFTVRFACDNCGKEWSVNFHEKVRVWRMNTTPIPPIGGRYMSIPPPTLIASDAREKPMKEVRIDCPNCKTFRDVKIVQRIPIEERSTID